MGTSIIVANHLEKTNPMDPKNTWSAVDASLDRVENWPKSNRTRRQRHKSALYLRLKKRKVLKFVKSGTPREFLKSSLLQNITTIEGGPFGDKRKLRKNSRTMPKQRQRGTLQCCPVLYITLKVVENKSMFLVAGLVEM